MSRDRHIGESIGGFFRGIGIEGIAVILLGIVAIGISIAWISIGKGIASALKSVGEGAQAIGEGAGKTASGGLMSWMFGDLFGSESKDQEVAP